MASQRVAFRLQPAKRERPRDHLSHLLANPPRRPQTTKTKTPLIATGIDPKYNTPIKIMSELGSTIQASEFYRSSKQKNGWIFIGDTPKDFSILQSEAKMKQVFGPKVKVSLPRSYHSADASKSNFLVFKGVSINITINEFKELLDFNKIIHAKAERMKSKRTGRDLPFIKLKCDDPNQAEALISGGLICQKTGIIFKVEEFRITPSIQQCFKCQGFGHKALNCTKNRNVLCVVKLIHIKTVQTKAKTPKCANCRGPDVANYRGCPAYKDQACSPNSNFLCLYCKTIFTTTLQQHIQLHIRANCIPGNKCGLTNRSATIVYQKVT